MPVITFNAYSFLQKKLREKQVAYTDVIITVKGGTRVIDLISQVQLSPEDVEVAFINGKVALFDTIIRNNDRATLLPPGTPGPYRVLLGFNNKEP
ncbi:MAG: MoaD/ThiS family protein [Anaerolineales bacterium]